MGVFPAERSVGVGRLKEGDGGPHRGRWAAPGRPLKAPEEQKGQEEKFTLWVERRQPSSPVLGHRRSPLSGFPTHSNWHQQPPDSQTCRPRGKGSIGCWFCSLRRAGRETSGPLSSHLSPPPLLCVCTCPPGLVSLRAGLMHPEGRQPQSFLHCPLDVSLLCSSAELHPSGK